MAVAAPSIGNRGGFRLSAKGQERAAGFMFILPALIIVIIFIFLPLFSAFLISFTNWNGLQPPFEAQGVGLRNYERILGLDGTTVVRDEFFVAIKNTFYYTLGVVPTQTVLALILAFIVNQQFLRFRGFFRVAFYFPSITSSIVIATIFLWLFNRNGVINGVITAVAGFLGLQYTPVTWINDANGIIHNFLRLFGVTIRTAPAWMTETNILGQTIWQWISGPSVTMLAIMLLAIWTTTGTMMLIFLAALQDIPRQLYEAASVDGATRWQQFRLITVPMLRPTTFFVLTIGLIGCFQVFDQIYVISQGNPAGTTKTIAWIVFRNLRDSQAGLGAALAFVLFVIIAIFTVIQRRMVGKTVQQ
ncbi:MAG: sugar ABC transporter permease [Candidatus Thermofonsia Clade 1 bacterium]|jgi:multiple sugar transport system permease protein|uniref:Sugar ABC transporter permease n=1 Tax=Candidatus Thermofonsia Clade 1 bacterium TaxID=2364210 RepID=A0A2M8P494_9CHLR|nr:MAG: sugar ABC transporter permease [Candidatus Thermofonsia Clade 1 bacterium]